MVKVGDSGLWEYGMCKEGRGLEMEGLLVCEEG